MKENIAKIVVGLPIEGAFDYSIPKEMAKDIKIGSRVFIPFKNFKKVGYVIDFSNYSKIKKIRAIISLIDYKPLLEKTELELLKKIANYYCCCWGEMIESALPLSIRKGKKLIIDKLQTKELNKKPQKRYEKGIFSVTLVHDVGADRRWDLLLEEIKKAIFLKRGVIFLEPELFYITRTAKWLKEKLNEDVTILHSKQSEKKELTQWTKIREGRINIVVGSRSAIFAPFKNLGLIIINEEDSQLYKQEQSPFYHAREIAILRAKQQKANLILVSQTPSLESYHSSLIGKYKFVNLKDRKHSASQVEIVDMNQEALRFKRGKAVLSPQLENNIQNTLEDSGRVILFINRLGFATSIRCKNCGYSLKCNRCNSGLIYHYKRKMLVCRFCNYQIQPLEICPQCKSAYVRYSGAGTEKLESEVNRLFPQAKINRWDSDVGIQSCDFDILISTQILLKGYINCDLLGVLQIDSSLNRVDFRSSEKVFSLLFRLSKLVKEKMIIQTRNPQHNCIEAIRKSDPFLFYRKELKLRKELGFPPFRHFIQIQLRGRSEEKVKNLAFSLYKKMKNTNNKNINVLEPFPASPSRLRGNYRWNILLKGKSVKKINSYINRGLKELKGKSGIIINVNVDI